MRRPDHYGNIVVPGSCAALDALREVHFFPSKLGPCTCTGINPRNAEVFTDIDLDGVMVDLVEVKAQARY